MTVLREYEYEDHTADIKVIGYGNTPKRAIEALVLGISNLIYNSEKVEKKESFDYDLEGKDILDIIYKVAKTVLEDSFFNKNLAIRDIRVKNLKRVRLESRKYKWYCRFSVYGEKYDKDKHEFRKEVKAVTLHDINITKIKKTYWTVELVVDV
ncbi:protein archease [Nanobdella aerobiophila]|uniref:Protein archease n=1 Tax=Nanobdella aerobiophila TaxID=2586965 RepID=A0A915WS35_9ARCH|nr:archease [Nanobdella aerobiophila]BBL45491.1 protein archease [Nanobdella aerobiophila]